MMMQPPAPMEGLAYYTQSLLALWPDKALVRFVRRWRRLAVWR